MADLTWSGADICDQILPFMGIDVDDASADDRTDALSWANAGYDLVTRGDHVIEEGYVRSHIWSWLMPWATLSLVDGTATYDLESDFGGLIVPFIHDNVSNQAFASMERATPEEVRRWYRDSDTEDDPLIFAVTPKTFTASTGQRWQVSFARVPDTDRTVYYRYRVLVDALTDASDDYPRGGPEISRLVCQGGKAEYERYIGKVDGPEARRFDRQMLAAIRRDRLFFAPDDEGGTIAQIDTGLGV